MSVHLKRDYALRPNVARCLSLDQQRVIIEALVRTWVDVQRFAALQEPIYARASARTHREMLAAFCEREAKA